MLHVFQLLADCTSTEVCEGSRPDISGASAEEELHALEDKIAEAQQRQAAATKQYNRVFTVCINAQQVSQAKHMSTKKALASNWSKCQDHP